MFRMATSNEMDAAETHGLIKGLTAIVQSHIDSMKTTNTQIQQRAATVENLTKAQATQVQPNSKFWITIKKSRSS